MTTGCKSYAKRTLAAVIILVMVIQFMIGTPISQLIIIARTSVLKVVNITPKNDFHFPTSL